MKTSPIAVPYGNIHPKFSFPAFRLKRPYEPTAHLFCLASNRLVETPAFSGDFIKGYVAYRSGDVVTALLESKPFAEQGHAKAQFNLGVLCANREDVPQDYKTAVNWYRLVAEQGNANAQFYLGEMYYYWQSVSQNDKAAVKWFSLVAEQGSAFAQYYID